MNASTSSRRALLTVGLLAAGSWPATPHAALAQRAADVRRAPAPRSARPPLVIISLDGFRWDYLDRGLTPNLSRLAARGVRARALVPAFPTKTFPNHYTLVTGLQPEHHGIVDNVMRDPATGAWFRINDTAAVRDARWWGGEPLWATAARQGVLSATVFWPGSEAPIGGVRPTQWLPYDGRMPNSARTTQVVDWLDLPPDARPDVVLLYFSLTDDAGHRFGPDSPQLDSAVSSVDAEIGELLEVLDSHGLGAARLNVVVVSDHGMAAVDTSRVVVLDDYLDPQVVRLVDAGPLLTLDSASGFADSVARALGRIPHLSAFRREETPARWHYRDNPRIPAFVGVAEGGWQVVPRAPLRQRPQGFIGGSHGFDNADAAMHGILVAAGPAFRRGAVVPPLGNVHVYELLCRAAGLRPGPNDGSPDSVRAFFPSRQPSAVSRRRGVR